MIELTITNSGTIHQILNGAKVELVNNATRQSVVYEGEALGFVNGLNLLAGKTVKVEVIWPSNMQFPAPTADASRLFTPKSPIITDLPCDVVGDLGVLMNNSKAGTKNFISILIILLIYFTLLFLFATVRFLKTPLEKIPEVPTIETIVAEPVVEPPIIEVEQVPFVEEPIIEIEEPLIEVQEPIVEIEEPVVEILEPIIEIEEPIVDIEEIVFEPPFFEEPEYFEIDEYDPWADFYVAGEEDYSIFSEGEYMVPLFINSEYLTDINVIFDNERVLVEVEELKELLSASLTESFRRELFATDKFYFTLEDLHELDVDAWFDYMTFELHLIFSSDMMPVRILSINRGGIARYSSYSMSGSETLKPAWFSWFTNLSAFSQIDVNARNDWKVSTASIPLQAKIVSQLG